MVTEHCCLLVARRLLSAQQLHLASLLEIRLPSPKSNIVLAPSGLGQRAGSAQIGRSCLCLEEAVLSPRHCPREVCWHSKLGH